MPSGALRPKTYRFPAAHAGFSCGLALVLFLFASKALQNAVAEGETRTISMHHIHTGEDITITYKREGRYDEAALEKLNWFLRDWRRGEQTRMDPHLIDLVWEVQRESSSKEPIWVVCGYRSPQTNAMLRRRSNGVARFSQHMLGHAMDFYVPGVPLEQLRVIGLRLQRGGVGFYPTSGSPFVHMDTGGVRMWPRMSREQLLHVFPDGRTAYLPTDGRPLAGYELALADIRKRGHDVAPAGADMDSDEGEGPSTIVASAGPANPFAKLLNLMDQQPESNAAPSPAVTSAPAPAPVAAKPAPLPPAAPKAKPQPANPLLAALEREAARRREAATVAAAAKPTQNGPDKIVTASVKPNPNAVPPSGRAPAQAPQRVAALTPNQVIAARGYWEGTPDAAPPVKPAAGRPAAAAQQRSPANATAAPAPAPAPAPVRTASTAPWALAHDDDRVPAEIALAYAAQPEQETAAAPTYQAASYSSRAVDTRAPAPVPAQAVQAPAATTIAVKRVANQVSSKLISAMPRLSSAIAAGAQFDNPWLRAVVLSPSVERYFTTLCLGDQDMRTLAPLVRKPEKAAVMTFGADPNPGLDAHRFSGRAVVFMTVVSYETSQAHTAALH